MEQGVCAEDFGPSLYLGSIEGSLGSAPGRVRLCRPEGHDVGGARSACHGAHACTQLRRSPPEDAPVPHHPMLSLLLSRPRDDGRQGGSQHGCLPGTGACGGTCRLSACPRVLLREVRAHSSSCGTWPQTSSGVENTTSNGRVLCAVPRGHGSLKAEGR